MIEIIIKQEDAKDKKAAAATYGSVEGTVTCQGGSSPSISQVPPAYYPILDYQVYKARAMKRQYQQGRE